MKRHFSTLEALKVITEPDSSTSSPPSDTILTGESDPDFVVALSSSSSAEGEEDAEDPGSGWTGRNGKVWFPTNADTTGFFQPARGVTPGSTRYAIVRVHSDCRLFVAKEHQLQVQVPVQ